jgi:hypothetical protein
MKAEVKLPVVPIGRIVETGYGLIVARELEVFCKPLHCARQVSST